MFIPSRCGEPVELEGREPILNTTRHLAWHPQGILENEWYWLEESRERVRQYEEVPGHEEQP